MSPTYYPAAYYPAAYFVMGERLPATLADAVESALPAGVRVAVSLDVDWGDYRKYSVRFTASHQDPGRVWTNATATEISIGGANLDSLEGLVHSSTITGRGNPDWQPDEWSITRTLTVILKAGG